MVARPRERARPLVLLVDDGNRHAMLLKLALMQRGYAIVVVHSLDGAVSMARAKPFDVVIVLRPNPHEVLASLGETRPPVALALGEESEAALQAGFDLVLRTPVDFGELDASVRGLLSRRRSGSRKRTAPRS